jgi:hypothetical protein
MNERLGLRLLGEIMEWPDERASREFQWLRLMARIKYDSYEDFRAGARFLERLAVWLQQFKQKDRETAYRFVKDRLIYIGPAQMRLLVERFYPEVVEKLLIDAVSRQIAIPSYLIWQNPDAIKAVADARRRSLFMALSDGARIDELRRANTGILDNEQIVVATQVDKAKWADIFKKLKKAQGESATFDRIYLIDDFIASGTTLLRFEEEEKKWDGKILRFQKTLQEACDVLPDASTLLDLPVHVHHYLATTLAITNVAERVKRMREEEKDAEWLDHVEFSYGYIFPPEIALMKDSSEPFIKLMESYYDPIVHQGPHPGKSGIISLMYGYGACGLPVVLEHNTPNNSVPLLWAETEGEPEKHVHGMRPLFRRRQRYSA